MCEIFPEFKSCCLCVPVAIGMILMAILSITSGVFGLCILFQLFEVNMKSNFEKSMNITDVDKAVHELGTLVPNLISAISALFIIAGVILLFATLMEAEGFVQSFVWIQFVNVLLGFLLVTMILVDCATSKTCVMSKYDWLSSSALLLGYIIYMFVWLYLISVANTFVLNIYM